MKKKKKIELEDFLAIVSILGFLAVVIQAFTGYDIGPWVNGLIFTVIGAGLAMLGAAWSYVKFSDGIDAEEMAHLMTTVVGALSFMIGLLILPIPALQQLNIPAIEGIKAVVAIFAIFLIAIESFFVKR